MNWFTEDALVNELNTNQSVMDTAGLEGDIDSINELFMGQGYGDAGQFMKNVAATESNLGQDKLGDYSFGAFQVDPMRYIDIVDRSKGGTAKERMDLVNEFLREKLGNNEFDLRTALDVSFERDDKGYVTSAKYNPNETLRQHNPLIGAALARLGLANVPESIPSDLKGQAQYWKDHWNTESGKGTPEHFISQAQTHYPTL